LPTLVVFLLFAATLPGAASFSFFPIFFDLSEIPFFFADVLFFDFFFGSLLFYGDGDFFSAFYSPAVFLAFTSFVSTFLFFYLSCNVPASSVFDFLSFFTTIFDRKVSINF